MGTGGPGGVPGAEGLFVRVPPPWQRCLQRSGSLLLPVVAALPRVQKLSRSGTPASAWLVVGGNWGLCTQSLRPCFSQAVLLHTEKLLLNLRFGLGSLAAACSGHAACCPRFQSCQHSLGSTCCPSGGHRPHGLVAELHVLAFHNCYHGLGYPLRPLGAPTGFWGA